MGYLLLSREFFVEFKAVFVRFVFKVVILLSYKKLLDCFYVRFAKLFRLFLRNNLSALYGKPDYA